MSQDLTVLPSSTIWIIGSETVTRIGGCWPLLLPLPAKSENENIERKGNTQKGFYKMVRWNLMWTKWPKWQKWPICTNTALTLTNQVCITTEIHFPHYWKTASSYKQDCCRSSCAWLLYLWLPYSAKPYLPDIGNRKGWNKHGNLGVSFLTFNSSIGIFWCACCTLGY